MEPGELRGIMNKVQDPRIARLIELVKGDSDVLAVILYGSRARGEETAGSDIDLCLVLPADHSSREDHLAVRERYLAEHAVADLHIFQQLPLYVRHRVLKEGVVLFCQDVDALYAVACRTARAYEDFKPIYRQCLAQVARVGP
jgi:uncharacterized protein